MKSLKNISKMILSFAIGFYGVSLILDTDNELIISKSIVFFTLVLFATGLLLIDELLND